jgi:hypothetical protein
MVKQFVIACAIAIGLPVADPSKVTCQVPGDPDARIYSLVSEKVSGSTRWVLSFRSRATAPEAIRLDLPDAAPKLTPSTARLEYQNANGGRIVKLSVTPAGASLEVFISHGLEINIDADLDPRVDLMNTEGPLRNVRCVIE